MHVRIDLHFDLQMLYALCNITRKTLLKSVQDAISETKILNNFLKMCACLFSNYLNPGEDEQQHLTIALSKPRTADQQLPRFTS